MGGVVGTGLANVYGLWGIFRVENSFKRSYTLPLATLLCHSSQQLEST